jgi:hypothetical protein
MKFTRHSPSSLNLFAASPSMFVLEKVLGRRQPVGAPAHRGTAIEDGVTHGLMNPAASLEECSAVAFKKYDTLRPCPATSAARNTARPSRHGEVALSRTAAIRRSQHCQASLSGSRKGWLIPIVGYFDYHWAQHNITIDLKTTEKAAVSVKIPHARQVRSTSRQTTRCLA